MKLLRIVLLLAFLGIFPLKGQWFEQYLYLPDSFGGGNRYGNRYIVWDSLDDRIYLFGVIGNTVAIDCQTNEKIGNPMLRNTSFLSATWHPNNNSIYALYCDSLTGLHGTEGYACLIVVFDCASNQVVSEIPIFIPNRSYTNFSLTSNLINNKIYLSLADSIMVIDCPTNQISTGIKFPSGMQSFPIWNCNNNYLYIFNDLNSEDKKIFVMDCISNEIIDSIRFNSYRIRRPEAAFFDRFRNQIVIITCDDNNPADNKVFVVDCERNVIKDTIVSHQTEWTLLWQIGFNPITNKLYIGAGNPTILYVIDLNQRQIVDSILTGKGFNKIIVNPLANRIIGHSDSLYVIDCNTNQIIGAAAYDYPPEYTQPFHNFLNPIDNKLYFACRPSRLAIFDASANYFIKTMKIGANLNEILWNPLTNRLYCSDNHEPLIMVFDGATSRTLGSINLKPWVGPTGIGALTVATRMNKIYASCGEGSIVTIDGNTDSVIQVITQLPDNVYFSYNPNNNKLYATPPWYSSTRNTYIIACSTDLIIGQIETGFPRYAYINLLTDKVYISHFYAAKTLVVDGAGDTVIKTLDSIMGDIVFRYQDNRIYISGFAERCFTILDGWTDTVITQISNPGIALLHLAYDSIDDRVYGAGYEGVWALDCQMHQIIDSLNNDSVPEWGFLFWNRFNNKLYYNYFNSNPERLVEYGPIKVLDCRTNQIIAEFPEAQRATRPIAWNSIDNRFYAGIYNRSALSVIRDFPQGVSEDKFDLLSEPKLDINRPNPFSKRTIIKFQITSREMVSLKVYDTAGKMIKTLKENIVNPGGYSLIWDGRDNYNNLLSSGIYFLRLETKDYQATKKIILAK